MVDKTLVVGGEMFNPSHPCSWKEPLASVRIHSYVGILAISKKILVPYFWYLKF